MDKFYPIIVVGPVAPDEGGGYIGYAPDLMGCMGDGSTPEEAFANTQEAVLEWIEEAKASDRPIPLPQSYSNKAKEDRAELLKIIKDQDEAIEGLSEELQKATQVIDGLKSTVRGVMTRIDELPMWSGLAVAQISRHGTGGEDSVH